jgi:hypothetical protein
MFNSTKILLVSILININDLLSTLHNLCVNHLPSDRFVIVLDVICNLYSLVQCPIRDFHLHTLLQAHMRMDGEGAKVEINDTQVAIISLTNLILITSFTLERRHIKIH